VTAPHLPLPDQIELLVKQLGELRAGSRVNLEIDLIARYVERLLTATAHP